MLRRFKHITVAACMLVLTFNSCTEKDYKMGDLSAPSDVTITAEVVGKDATHPNGDGSGNVKITLAGNGVLAYHADFDASDGVEPKLVSPTITQKYTGDGINTYRITVVAYGKGATATTVTQTVTVRFDFTPDAAILTNLMGSTAAGKSWVVDKDASGHFGVGPWLGSSTPEWYAATPNEKAACCGCFYSAKFLFKKVAAGNYTLTVTSPDGAFTKTGSLAGGLPGIPATGDEGCYAYSGGTSNFSFIPSTTAVDATASTKVAMKLGGSNTYIGYGAQLKEYEILSISATNMYLRVQGTETGNAWYLKMKAE